MGDNEAHRVGRAIGQGYRAGLGHSSDGRRTGEGMADNDRVVTSFVETSVGVVSHLQRRQQRSDREAAEAEQAGMEAGEHKP